MWSSVDEGICNSLVESIEGREWLSNVPNAWNNRYQIGLSESITVVNVFDTNQPLTTYHIAHSDRGKLDFLPVIDNIWIILGFLWAAFTFNVSLVQYSTNFLGDDSPEATYCVYPFTNVSIVIHDILGPFQSIDAFYIAPLTDLIDLLWWESYVQCQSRNSFYTIYFSFDDECGQPKPMQMTINPQSALFAYSIIRAAGVAPMDSCDLCLWSPGVLSEPLNNIPCPTSTIELTNTTSKYLWCMTVVTTVVLLAVGIATIALYLHDKIYSCSLYLLYFNRITGPVWLGRPLMLLRSTTAIIILSTSPIVFDSSLGLGRFQFELQSQFDRFLFASEALWLTNVSTDVICKIDIYTKYRNCTSTTKQFVILDF
ncbi:hypothetical protein THRCLA_21223, partial [Thraustotheca clavata]